MFDAKYKPLDVNNISREDRFQMISYMHVLKKGFGYLLYPARNNCTLKVNKILNGYGGEMGTVPFCVPQNPDWMEFFNLMQKAENDFCKNILNC